MRIEVIFFIVMVVLSVIDAMKKKRARQAGQHEIDPQTGEVMGPREAPRAVARHGSREEAPPTVSLPVQQRERTPAGEPREGVTLEDLLRGLSGLPAEVHEPEPVLVVDSAEEASRLETSQVAESDPVDVGVPTRGETRKETTWWNKDDDLHPYQLAKRRSDPFAFLRGRAGMRRAVISQEILGPPLSLRKE